MYCPIVMKTHLNKEGPNQHGFLTSLPSASTKRIPQVPAAKKVKPGCRRRIARPVGEPRRRPLRRVHPVEARLRWRTALLLLPLRNCITRNYNGTKMAQNPSVLCTAAPSVEEPLLQLHERQAALFRVLSSADATYPIGEPESRGYPTMCRRPLYQWVPIARKFLIFATINVIFSNSIPRDRDSRRTSSHGRALRQVD